jgi:anti-repressor protein
MKGDFQLKGLKVVENGLVPIYETNDGDRTINAREMHAFLESRQDFSNWIQGRILKYGFVEGEDFSIILLKNPKTRGRPTKEYFITLDMGKELAMVENNEKGRAVRKYYIAYEKAHKALVATSLPATTSALVNELERQRAINKQQEPLVLYARLVQVSDDAMPAAEFARMMRQARIRIGRNRFYKWLCGKGYAQEVSKSKYIPLQKGLDDEILQYGDRIIVRPNGTIRMSPTLFITGRGQVRLTDELIREETEKLQMSRQKLLFDDDPVLSLGGGELASGGIDQY